MKKSITGIVLLIVLVSFSNARALDIKEGTITIGGSSNAFFETRRFDKANNEFEYSIGVIGSYFLRDNLELGLAVDYGKEDVSKIGRATTKGFAPFVSFHSSLNENSNVYYGVGLIFTRYDSIFGQSSDTSGVSLRGGLEYFFNPHVALDIGARLSYIKWDLSGYSDTEIRFFGPVVGLIVFF